MDYFKKLYLENAAVYQPVLEAGLATAPQEASGVCAIFEKFGKTSRHENFKILDVSCGIGRHSINLVKLGYHVVGIDFSPYFVRTARRLAKKAGCQESVEFVEGDTKSMEKKLEDLNETGFDGIICMDSAFSRATRSEEINLLRSMYNAASKKCVLIIEIASREHMLKYLRFAKIEYVQRFPHNLERHIRSSYDKKTKRIHTIWRFMQELPNKNLLHLLTLNLDSRTHSKSDLVSELEASGWSYIRSYGRIAKLDRFTPDSYHIVIVARKNERMSI